MRQWKLLQMKIEESSSNILFGLTDLLVTSKHRDIEDRA